MLLFSLTSVSLRTWTWSKSVWKINWKFVQRRTFYFYDSWECSEQNLEVPDAYLIRWFTPYGFDNNICVILLITFAYNYTISISKTVSYFHRTGLGHQNDSTWLKSKKSVTACYAICWSQSYASERKLVGSNSIHNDCISNKPINPHITIIVFNNL